MRPAPLVSIASVMNLRRVLVRWALCTVLLVLGADAQVNITKVYANVTSNFGRLTLSWNSWLPPRGTQVNAFLVEALPWDETWLFDEPFTSRTGWLYDDGSSTTNFSSSLSSMTYGSGTLGFTLVGPHGTRA